MAIDVLNCYSARVIHKESFLAEVNYFISALEGHPGVLMDWYPFPQHALHLASVPLIG